MADAAISSQAREDSCKASMRDMEAFVSGIDPSTSIQICLKTQPT